MASGAEIIAVAKKAHACSEALAKLLALGALKRAVGTI